ncbi:helix-turn-helix domain-containing protein [Enterococcus rivorum]|uniref:HTH cro/C1-type domain-containing protein n=1 Tax=Enterococcus rivorum TaxID=762845 RepID=A0A1E5KWE3_9ENTE|nr:helix-turn-helix domain-containing protein [Enterococcus rivorum]MBP2099036.1 transcriptional regulator with XRE-family HTH domain [Enterococcus rivorum]OEH82182.1 hypothetical protein BCR26_14005 [Enterococcus rivorum]
MKVLGNKFREARKKQRLSQTALAAGICTQTTVSKIENRNRCESLDIFYSLCLKLGVAVNDYLAENKEQELERILDEVEVLCIGFKPELGYKMLSNYFVDVSQLPDSLAIKYFYYMGATRTLSMNGFKEALFYLSQAEKLIQKNNIYNIMSTNAIGITYLLSESMEKAQPYFEKANQMLQEFPEDALPAIACGLYYNLAKYYSELKEYQKSIELCDAGIKLSRKEETNIYLDALLYEKAYNEFYLNGTAESYKTAYYFTRFIENQHILGHVIKDMERYDIAL